jgi:hypothetical protein
MKTYIVDGFLILLIAFGGVANLLSSNGYINPIFKPAIMIVIISGIVLEAGWVTIGRRISAKKQESGKALIILNDTLEALIGVVSKDPKVEVRANIMVPKGFCPKKLYIKYYSPNMKNAGDLDIVLEKWEACAGQAWGTNKALAANLNLSNEERGRPQWLSSQVVQNKTKRLKVLVSHPIRKYKEPDKVIGILNVDSNDPAALFLLEDDAIENIKSFALMITSILHNLEQTK